MSNEVTSIILLGWVLGMMTAVITEFLCTWYSRYSIKDSDVPTWKEMYLAERDKK